MRPVVAFRPLLCSVRNPVVRSVDIPHPCWRCRSSSPFIIVSSVTLAVIVYQVTLLSLRGRYVSCMYDSLSLFIFVHLCISFSLPMFMYYVWFLWGLLQVWRHGVQIWALIRIWKLDFKINEKLKIWRGTDYSTTSSRELALPKSLFVTQF